MAHIIFNPKSLLAFIIAVSLVAYLGAIAIGNTKLEDAAIPILIIFGAFFVAFLLLSLYRNVRSL